MNVINQKGTRPQDKPVTFDRLSDDDRRLIREVYPDLADSLR